jgi:cobalamin biosynthetic protein CobC
MIEGGRLWHGGDLDEARRLFPGAPKPWIDLSTGINPAPYPLPDLLPSAFERLPAAADLAALETAAARAYGAADPACVVAAPGTQMLIELLPRLRPAGRVAVIGPTYAEHVQSWRKNGHAVIETAGIEPGADVTVLCNPNNPDGRIWPRHRLLEAAESLRGRGGWLVVDEAFIDLEPVDSLIPLLPPGVIVLRSFGKTYGLAGLRLGFAVAGPDLARKLRAALGPWPVSGPAIAIARRALADQAWREAAAAARADDARRLDHLLASLGEIAGGTRLFRLFEGACAPALFDHLGRHGVWVRRFQGHADRLRFGLPGSDAEWTRLADVIATFNDSTQDRPPGARARTAR